MARRPHHLARVCSANYDKLEPVHMVRNYSKEPMKEIGRFSSDVVLTLSRRAALQCSNPECDILTSGPTDDDSGALNLGEAAHIYGRTEDAARYNSVMTATERSDITNGIWLCRNCHKAVDGDPIRFPAELLFMWRREHERAILERVGQKGDLIREKLKSDRLRPFNSASKLAQQIAIDKPKFWEYKLTAELLRTELGQVERRWQRLNRGLYVRSATIVPTISALSDWFKAKMDECAKVIASFKLLIEEELPLAWGEPGVPGNELEILDVCRLIVGAGEMIVDWEEQIEFTHVPEEFEEIKSVVAGAGGRQLEEMMRVPTEISHIFDVESPCGEYKIGLVFKLPEDFNERFSSALKRGEEVYLAKQRRRDY